MHQTSRIGVLAGILIATGLPLAYWLLALLIQAGIAPYDPLHALLGVFGLAALSEVVLGPLGIVVVGRSAGIRGATWMTAFVVALPVLAIAWFLGLVALSGSLGNPF
jgi:hypothetical protein